MTEPHNGQAAPEPPRPSLLLRWAGPGQSDVEVIAEGGLSLSQLMGGAFLIECVAREARQGEVTRAALSKGLFDPRQLPPDLARLFRE